MSARTLTVRMVSSRIAFGATTYVATLTPDDSDGDPRTLRSRETWQDAARAALGMADRRGWTVTNRALVERSISARDARAAAVTP